MSYRGYRKIMFTLIAGILFLAAAPLCAQLTVTASATPLTGPAPLDVTFTSTVAGGTGPYAYDWDFGDGTPHDTGANPTHTYTLAGAYTVRLTVTDSTAPTPLTTTVTVATIRVLLAVTATVDSQCMPAPVNACFEGSASGGTPADPNDPSYTYTWNFGDGTSAVGRVKCHGYMNNGVYNVTLTVRDGAGNTGTATLVLYVYQDSIPFTVTASADTTLGLAPLEVNFSGYAIGPANLSYTPFWDFGDGETCDGDWFPQHIFAAPGIYTVTLTVNGFDPAGICATSWTNTDTLIVQAVEDPSIFITRPLVGAQVSGSELTLESYPLTSASVVRVDYYVNDTYVGSSSIGPYYRLVLDSCGANGTYTITAILYDSKGESASDEINVTITNPTLDGTNYVLNNPFRVKFFGTGFQIGAKLYINGLEVPVTKVLNSTVIVAKGGKALKALIPQGVPVEVTVVNRDGSCTGPVTFQR